MTHPRNNLRITTKHQYKSNQLTLILCVTGVERRTFDAVAVELVQPGIKKLKLNLNITKILLIKFYLLMFCFGNMIALPVLRNKKYSLKLLFTF